MNYIVWMTIVMIIIIVVILNLELLRRKTVSQLNQLLYIENKADVYLMLLQKNKLFKLLFSKSTMILLEANAYVMLDHQQALETCFKALQLIHLTKSEKIEVFVKQLFYYAKKGNKVKAKLALESLECLLKDKPKYKKLLVESNIIYGVYINKDKDLLLELEQLVEISSGSALGLVYYRMAKLNYFHGNTTQAVNCLKAAQPLLINTTWCEIIKLCLEDLEALKRY